MSNKTRRDFLINTAQALSIAGFCSMGLMSYAGRSYSLPAQALRPPGALNEDEFNSACIRCGLCVNDCPFPTLSLATADDDVPIGTPFFTARKAGCEMCEDIFCVLACPTGALNKDLKKIENAKMGLARIVDQKSCIAFQGLRCEICYNVCPLLGKAISLELSHNKRSQKHAIFTPLVHFDVCTGCGKCEEACILEEAAIKVLPIKIAKGKMQDHYRLGWEEKQKAGGSLVTPDAKHEYNLPQGKSYENKGRGLSNTNIPPSSGDPLDTLKTLNKNINR